jgi:hypothetical protein
MGNMIVAGDGNAYLPYSYFNNSENFGVTYLTLLGVSPDGSFAKIQLDMGTTDALGGTCAGLFFPYLSTPAIITNAATGVAVFAGLNQFSSEDCSAGPTPLLQISYVSQDSVTSQVTAAVNAFVPALQRGDGSYIGTGYGNLIALGLDGSLLWQQQLEGPSLTPLYATADGGAIVTSSTQCPTNIVTSFGGFGASPLCSPALGTLYTVDQNGSVTGQTPDTGTVYSWTNQWCVDPEQEVSKAQSWPLALGGWTGGSKGNLSGTATAAHNPWFPPLDSCNDPQSASFNQCPGPFEVANPALAALTSLVSNRQCPLCQQWVFAKLPGGSADGGATVQSNFSKWLNQSKSLTESAWPYQTPGLYNGTMSKAPQWWLCYEGSLLGWECDAHNLLKPAPTVADYFTAHNGATNVSRTPSHEGYVSFYNTTYWGAPSCYVTLSSDTKGTREKSITFHEALHGFSGLDDPHLRAALGAPSVEGETDSEEITDYLAHMVFGWPTNYGGITQLCQE